MFPVGPATTYPTMFAIISAGRRPNSPAPGAAGGGGGGGAAGGPTAAMFCLYEYFRFIWLI